VIVFRCDDFTYSGTSDHEIERMALCDPAALPSGVSPGTRRRIQETLAPEAGPHIAEW